MNKAELSCCPLWIWGRPCISVPCAPCYHKIQHRLLEWSVSTSPQCTMVLRGQWLHSLPLSIFRADPTPTCSDHSTAMEVTEEDCGFPAHTGTVLMALLTPLPGLSYALNCPNPSHPPGPIYMPFALHGKCVRTQTISSFLQIEALATTCMSPR